jgi:hypothetical protein
MVQFSVTLLLAEDALKHRANPFVALWQRAGIQAGGMGAIFQRIPAYRNEFISFANATYSLVSRVCKAVLNEVARTCFTRLTA